MSKQVETPAIYDDKSVSGISSYSKRINKTIKDSSKSDINANEFKESSINDAQLQKEINDSFGITKAKNSSYVEDVQNTLKHKPQKIDLVKDQLFHSKSTIENININANDLD